MKVGSVSDGESVRNEGLAGWWGEMSRIWKQEPLGVPIAYQHPPDCRRWYLPILVLSSSHFVQIMCRCFDLKWWNLLRTEQQSVHIVNHAGWTTCKIDATACKLLNYISLLVCMNLLMRLQCVLFTAPRSCVDVSRLSTAGVLRDEEESVSSLYLI